MPGLDVSKIRDSLDRDGFAVAVGTPAMVTRAFAVDGAMRLTSQGQNKFSTTLVPYTTESAPRRSLSAVYGLGEQPLHTDGAHMLEPPDVIVLSSASVSATATIVWAKPAVLPEFVTYAVFTVRGNGQKFIAPAVENGTFRFDPVCMSPGDAFAKQTVEYFDSERDLAVVHQWDSPEKLLFLDNRKVLHARQSVISDEEVTERKVERLTFKLRTNL